MGAIMVSKRAILAGLVAALAVAPPAHAQAPVLAPEEARAAVVAELEQAIEDSDTGGRAGVASAAECSRMAPNLVRCAAAIRWLSPRNETCRGEVWVRRLPPNTLRHQPEVRDEVFAPFWACDRSPPPSLPATGLSLEDGRAEALRVTIGGDTSLVWFDPECARVDTWTVACRRIEAREVLGDIVFSTSVVWATNRYGGGVDVIQADAFESFLAEAAARNLAELLIYAPRLGATDPPPPAAEAPPATSPALATQSTTTTAAPAPPLAPAPLAVDRIPPALVWSPSRKGRRLALTLSCPTEACRARVTVRYGNTVRTLRRALRHGSTSRVRMTVALRRRVRVTVVVTDAAGNRLIRRRTL